MDGPGRETCPKLLETPPFPATLPLPGERATRPQEGFFSTPFPVGADTDLLKSEEPQKNIWVLRTTPTRGKRRYNNRRELLLHDAAATERMESRRGDHPSGSLLCRPYCASGLPAGVHDEKANAAEDEIHREDNHGEIVGDVHYLHNSIDGRHRVQA